jgi:hypothetical protein
MKLLVGGERIAATQVVAKLLQGSDVHEGDLRHCLHRQEQHMVRIQADAVACGQGAALTKFFTILDPTLSWMDT